MKRHAMIYDLDDLLSRFSVSLRNHSSRVAVCSAIIAEHAGAHRNFFEVPGGASLSEAAHLGGTCHDIGKLMLPAIETKSKAYKMHPSLGADFLEKHKIEMFGEEPSAQVVTDIVRYHHERIDGAGFPAGLKGYDIPLIAGICSAADELDYGMYLDRTQYKNETEVYMSLKAQAGKQFHECVWELVESAWHCLSEKYVSWNRAAGNDGRE